MRGILTQIGPTAAERPDGLVAWAGTAVAHDLLKGRGIFMDGTTSIVDGDNFYE